MATGCTTPRRWMGGIALGLAMLMLLAGMTFLKNRLQDAGFLVYWTACLALTAVAMVIAFRDMRALQRRTREEQRDLMEVTLKDIAEKAKARAAENSQKSQR